MKKADTTRKYVTTKKYNKLVDEVERLQKQLNEANEVIKNYANKDNWSDIMDGCGYSKESLYVNDCGYSSAENYLNKFGVR